MKAHSARIPDKNFRLFANKPLFRWILDTLAGMPEIDRIIINTDARAVLEKHGFEESERIMLRDRKAELCGDEVSMNRIIEDDLSAVASECFLMTHTTNPLLSADTIRRALEAYENSLPEHDSLFSVNRYQTRFYREDGSAINHDPETLLPTQQLEPWFEENSNLYIFSLESFRSAGRRIGLRPRLFETPPSESVDIDNSTNWHIAELLALSKMIGKVSEEEPVSESP